jgi:hypothetical protein
MEIRITEHARERAIERGATREEIIKVLKEGNEVLAKNDRKEKELVFEFNKEWLGKMYPQKKVEVIFVEKENEIIVITVKVFYGTWR